MTSPDQRANIREAALRLAAKRPWRQVTLQAIAAEAGLALSELAQHASSKADILRGFSRDIDLKLLASLQSEPLDGEAHDRLVDLMLRRIDLLKPNKAALKSIAAAPADGAADLLALLCTTLESQGWFLAAAGIEPDGMRTEFHKLGLAKIYADTLRIWLDDDDPGMARTMAALDRKLRDAEAWLRRLEIPIAMCKGFAGAIRAYRELRQARRAPEQPSPAPDVTAD